MGSLLGSITNAAGGLLGGGKGGGQQGGGGGSPSAQQQPQMTQQQFNQAYGMGPGGQNPMGNGVLTGPGAAEQYSTNVLNRYGQGANIPQLSNNTQQAYNQFQQMAPANLDPYYQRAAARQTSQLGALQAAQGGYGSSAGFGQTSDALANLNAQQANQEAQYGLQRAGLGGQLASSADQNSLAGSQNQLGWTQGLGQIANMGQQSQENRYQNAFNNQLQMGDRMSGLMQNTYGNMANTDQALMGNTIAAESGLGTDAVNQQNAAKQGMWQDAQNTESLLGGAKGGGKGGGK